MVLSYKKFPKENKFTMKIIWNMYVDFKSPTDGIPVVISCPWTGQAAIGLSV